MTNIDLLKKANEVIENSYSPYSNFKVGAAILLTDGTVVTGTNVENASFGATICAERSAIVSLISQGLNPKDIKKIAITSYMDTFTPPCALCRQVMGEFFNDDVEIIMGNKNLDTKVTSIEEILQYRFTKKELGDN